MWIVELALRRPYTFVVIALLIAVLSSVFMVVTPKDIFPNINIPIVSVIWSYAGLPAEEFAQRITTYSEYTLSNNVNDIERIESQTVDGVGLVRMYFHPYADIPTAIAESTAASQAILRRMPPGMLPPTILRYYVNTVPIIQMILSGETITESELYDYGNWRIRQSIATIPGATLPTPYGGKVRQLMVDVDSHALQARGLSARDINSALLSQVLTTPLGDARIGNYDYRVNLNNTPVEPESFNDIPVGKVDQSTIFLRDVAFAHDGFAPQTNVVRQNGAKSVLMQVLKNGAASTLDIVNQVWQLLPTIQAAAPKGMNINLIFDQSVFVKKAIQGVVIEGVLAAALTGSMVLIFLGSWRSTLIVLVSIPLSIMTSIIFLSLIGETLNIMTLGGLALAIGILVDDATVAIENIHRNVSSGKPLEQAILDGSYEVAIPAFVSTLSICIVFLPVVLLVGPAKFLFTPFALAVVFAIAASYFLSRTLVPVMIKFILPPEMYMYTGGGPKTALDRYHVRFSERFHRFRHHYGNALQWALDNRPIVLLAFGLIFASALLISPFIGEDFFPSIDAGQLRLHVRAPSGTRIEVTEQIFHDVEDEIKKVISPDDIEMLMDNIGMNPVPYTLAFGDNATVGGYDGEILVSLKRERQYSTQEYMALLRRHLSNRFPNLLFYFQPADMVNQILNLGLPSPIDVKVVGYDQENNLKIAQELVEKISHIPGAADAHIHQVVDFPELFLNVDRMQLAKAGLTQSNVTNDILINFSDSTTVTPNFWLDRKSGVPYLIAVQNPKYRVNTVEGLLHIPISSPLTQQSQLLCDLCQLERRSTVGVVNHLNIQPVYDIYANVQGRDLGGVASDIQTIVNSYKEKMKPGNSIMVSGLVSNMQTAFQKLGIGFIFAVMLVYFLMVINFQSWLDPFVIIMAIPGAFAGIVWSLFLTGTTFNIPSLMGAIMSVGVVTANSILLVTFANFQLKEGKTSIQAIHAAALTRLRPILMTALAMIVGMIPMALAIGEGGEQNAPLGRAVIGGLAVATLTTLFFVPVIFSLLRHKENPYLHAKPRPYQPPEHQTLENEGID
ncbi:efflux RND transporter permease subunit [Candidatus Protochlamydia phocaeensis]|uniref:efflux RND transporter permease subunit n=1 Tax=Candidatus Protochlamydia phocaeensis TaxID=1414722 RepID=UPI000839387F|nr:efflux RND transporter permease subunit [Candidatus Protochlamydia phocaeensis]